LFSSRNKKRMCEALRPTPSPNHVNCLPGECSVCYTICDNVLTDQEQHYCSKCIKTYISHPSPRVRYAFLLNGIEDQSIDQPVIKQFENDPDLKVAELAAYALRIGAGAMPF